MKDNLRESLSALMDNEGDELELRRVLRVLDDSPDTAEHWRRYHLARSLMQRDRDIDVSTDLSAGIMARIKDEPVPRAANTSRQVRRQGSLSFAGSAAVAATVSLMVITGVQFYNGMDVAGTSEVASRNIENAPSSTIAPASMGADSLSTPVDMPLFQTSPMLGNGLMSVGAGDDSAPLFMSPNQRQSQRADLEQARLLQSYLDRHADGAAYRSGEAWMPLLRASAQESLSTR
ncbi:sigma-E factor negative regulatory protein [Modicisalibacter luteus]|uniref:Sigma-E factor negative regulatory protein n=2 Tax=Modicisalibacter luteus TaxID=453962 RepID=A0ABV7M4D2_9GAMM|nr:sigma-E factor negative regulatory protein [Halomonas lutea]GHA89387.1 sigma factor AlgU negative regulatory protein [Halomonas lutea]